jgi:hypothetical protein
MRVINKWVAISALSTVAAVGAVGATPAGAQAQSFAVVEYMKVQPGGDAAYLELEKAWKPLHEARVKVGLARGWYLYRVASPLGSSADHNYVTVAIYADYAAMENPFPAALVAKVIAGKDMDAFSRKTLTARDYVRSETFRMQGFTPEAASNPARYLRVEYMRVPAGSHAAYADVEKQWRKLHDVRIKEGVLASWGLYSRVLPGGSDYPYNYVTVSGYNAFKDMDGLDFAGLVQKAGLGNANELSDRTGKARDLVRSEDWVLVDYVQAP